MNRNTNLLARLMLTQLPGLVGAMQLAAVAPPSLSELARRQRSQNMVNALLSTASGLLPPSPNGYPAVQPQRLGGQAAQAQARRMLAPEPAEGSAADALAAHDSVSTRGVPARLVGRAAGAHHQSASRVPRLREFTGTLGNRLNSPPVLPGGWKLYGYERDTGSPVYIGPGRQLRVYE
jgi:hypothetical protein